MRRNIKFFVRAVIPAEPSEKSGKSVLGILLCAPALILAYAVAARADIGAPQRPLAAPVYAEHRLPSPDISEMPDEAVASPVSSAVRATESTEPVPAQVLNGGVKVGLAVAGAVALPALAVPFAVIALGSAIGLLKSAQSASEEEEWNFIWDLF